MRILGQINPARANDLTASIHAITLGSAVKHIQPRFRYSFSADISSVAKLQYLLTSLIPPERNHSKLKDDAATRKVGQKLPHLFRRHFFQRSLLREVGNYAAAAKELEAYADLSDSVDQHPVLMDCYRALRRWAEVTSSSGTPKT